MFNFLKSGNSSEPQPHHPEHRHSNPHPRPARPSIRIMDDHPQHHQQAQTDHNEHPPTDTTKRQPRKSILATSGDEGHRLPRRSIRFDPQDDSHNPNLLHQRRRSRKSLLRRPAGSESYDSLSFGKEGRKNRESVVSDFERSQRRSTFMLSREELIERMKYGTTCWYRFKRRLFKIIRGFLKYIRALFSIPWSLERVSLRLEKDLDIHKRDSGSVYEDFMKESDLEVMCNYQNLTRDVFEAILQERKDLQAAKDTYHVMKVDLDQFPSWTQGNVDRLRYTFQVFDVSGDGLVDFDEFSTVLVEFGDQSPEEMRRKHFDLVKNQSSDSIDFLSFLKLVYDLTKDEDSMEDEVLADTFRSIDRNMGRIRGLDVVQQLQAGLF